MKLVAKYRTGEAYKSTNAETGVKSPRFRYTVTGSAEALAEFKRIKDAEGYYREDEDGNALFTSKHKLASITLEIVDGIIIPKTSDETMLGLESLLETETNHAIIAVIAQKIAEHKIAMVMRGSAGLASSSAPVEASAEEAVSEDDANL